MDFTKKGIEPFMNDEYNKRIEVQDLTETPPIEEPARQYFFMAKARQYVQQEQKRLGRPLTAAGITFGCQMNAVHGI